MALMDEGPRRLARQPNIPFGGTANPDAFTDTRWVTVRGDIAPHPF